MPENQVLAQLLTSLLLGPIVVTTGQGRLTAADGEGINPKGKR
jgi:hypothetical protein